MCPKGWEYEGGKCYHTRTSGCLNFYEAKTYCESRNSSLPVVENDIEYYFLKKETNQKAWIGLTDEIKENDWVWIRSVNSPFTKWLPGKPDGKIEENCAVLEKQKNETGYNDMNCKATCAEVICQR